MSTVYYGYEDAEKTILHIASSPTTYATIQRSQSSTGWQSNNTKTKTVIFDDIITPVGDISTWFSGCANLVSIVNIENFDVSNVTNMTSLFYNCKSLTSLDLSKFDTSNVSSMNSMFSGCKNLTSLDLSKFDTSNVSSMYSMFNECASLTSLDLSKFDTSSLTDTRHMFNRCTSLETIYVSDTWDVSNVITSGYMFYNCKSIRGGNGTRYNESYIDATMANYETGYLTYKETSNIRLNGEDVFSIYFNGEKVTSLYLNGTRIY